MPDYTTTQRVVHPWTESVDKLSQTMMQYLQLKNMMANQAFQQREQQRQIEQEQAAPEAVRQIAAMGGLVPQQAQPIGAAGGLVIRQQPNIDINALIKSDIGQKFLSAVAAKRLEKQMSMGMGDKNLTEEQLTQQSLFHPDPEQRKSAQKVLDAMQNRKLAIAKETAKAQMTGKEEGLTPQAERLGKMLAKGQMSPSQIKNSFGFAVSNLAIEKAIQEDPKYNPQQAEANYDWYKSPNTQRLIRRTTSIVTKGGAADEAIRFAELVDNPAGTPINNLTGKAKVMFGNSQRSLLNLVHGLSSEEIQQIMGAQGGGERFLEFTNALNDTNQSVEQYVNNVKELKYLIYTRQSENVRGTPEQGKWEKMGEQFKEERPYAAPEQQSGRGKTIVRTGKEKRTGKKVIMYSDGSVEYAQ